MVLSEADQNYNLFAVQKYCILYGPISGTFFILIHFFSLPFLTNFLGRLYLKVG